MGSLLNQGDPGRLKYLVVWTYETEDPYARSGPSRIVRLRTDFAESEEEVRKIVFNESIRHSVREEREKGLGNPRTEFTLAPNFKVEVLSLSLVRGFHDEAFSREIREAAERRLKELQDAEDRRFAGKLKETQEREYETYLYLKSKFEKAEVLDEH